MDGAPVKPRGRKRPVKKAEGAAAAGAGRAGAAAGATAPAAAGRTTTDATEETQQDEAAQPQPTLSQRLVKSLKQLSQLGGGSKAEEGEEVEQQPLQEQAQEPAPPEPADQGAEERQHLPEHLDEGEEGRGGGVSGGSRLRRLGHRLAALLPRSPLHLSAALGDSHSALAAAAALTLLLLLLGGGLLAAHQGRTHHSQLVALQAQLAAQQAAATAVEKQLQVQVAALEHSVDQLGARLGASSSQLAALEHTCSAQAAAASNLHAELTTARDAIAQLQLGAAASAAQAGNASEAAAARAAGGQRVREVAREEVTAALEQLAADRTGMPDYALAAAGGAVVAHSQAHLPQGAGQGAGGTLGALYFKLQGGGVHPQASRLLLAPLTQPGACLPLVGPSGWVDIRLSQPIRPTAFTYQHIPAAIAHDLRSAPRAFSLLGFIGKPPSQPAGQAQQAASDASAAAGSDPAAPSASGSCAGCSTAGAAGEDRLQDTISDAQPAGMEQAQPAPVPAALAEGGVLLGQWQYDVHSTHDVQTFAVDSTSLPPGRAIDHVRLVVASNWGHPGFTCLYRLRMHGTPAVAVPAAAAA